MPSRRGQQNKTKRTQLLVYQKEKNAYSFEALSKKIVCGFMVLFLRKIDTTVLP
jgi:hypothetical protein